MEEGCGLDDGPCSRQLSTTKNPVTIAKVSELVSTDQRITLKFTQDPLCIKQEMICPIFHDNLGKRQICIMFFHTFHRNPHFHYVKLVLGVSVQSGNKTSQHGVRNKIIIETQSMSLAKVNDENNVDLSVSYTGSNMQKTCA